MSGEDHKDRISSKAAQISCIWIRRDTCSCLKQVKDTIKNLTQNCTEYYKNLHGN